MEQAAHCFKSSMSALGKHNNACVYFIRQFMGYIKVRNMVQGVFQKKEFLDKDLQNSQMQNNHKIKLNYDQVCFMCK